MMRPCWPREGKRDLEEADRRSALGHRGMGTEDRNWVNVRPNLRGGWWVGREGPESYGGWAAPLRKGAERDAEIDQTILRCRGPGRMKPQARANSDQLPTKACLWTPSLPLLL